MNKQMISAWQDVYTSSKVTSYYNISKEELFDKSVSTPSRNP